MKHLGDITKIDWSQVEPVDVVTGGSPCQDLSVAGKRAGLAGERSGLYMEQIRCVKELRQADVLRGRTGQFIRPRFMVWENVPGAFSSGTPKGSDFAAVIEELIKIAEPDADVCILPPSNGWTKSGCYYADDGRWSIAWRVHDAQFWGVPQRRKRIALVADFGGLAAPEVLFERKGLSGNFEPSGAEGKGVAGSAESGANGAIQGVDLYNQTTTGNVAKSLNAAATDADHIPCVMNNQSVFRTEPILLESNQNHATIQTGGVCTSLPASMGMGGGYVPMIAPCGKTNTSGAKVMSYGIDHVITTGGNCTEQGSCVYEDVQATLKSGGTHAVYDARGNGGKICPTITGDHNAHVSDYTAILMEEV